MFVCNLLMDVELTNKSRKRKRKAALNVSFSVKKERNSVYQKVSTILQKPSSERSADENEFLNNSKDIVKQITQRKAQRQKVKDRAQEYEDASDVLSEKCKLLADALSKSNHLVVYTGAGISTAARIPDYRGSNGIWTLLQQGKDIGLHDLSRAEPTLTHMALYGLYRTGMLKHVVSQNCDGLHLRSGLPRTILSEVHGNMYLEVCAKCLPCNHYLRLFDVTENTARYSHETLRLCYKCGNPLKDTIVHFGERGKLQWPLNWKTACEQADKADVILCLGSSLKVLKKYPWLWCMDKPIKKRPKLYIVNLQWTPKDDHSTLKINGKCDAVMEQVMSHLGTNVPKYVRTLDPIFHHATILNESETHTTTRNAIQKVPSSSSVCNTTDSTAAAAAAAVSASCPEQNSSDCNTDLMCSSTTTVNSISKTQIRGEEKDDEEEDGDNSNSGSSSSGRSGSSGNSKDNENAVPASVNDLINSNELLLIKKEELNNKTVVPDTNCSNSNKLTNHVSTNGNDNSNAEKKTTTTPPPPPPPTENGLTKVKVESDLPPPSSSPNCNSVIKDEEKPVQIKSEEREEPSRSESATKEKAETAADGHNGVSSGGDINADSVKVYNGIHFLHGRNLWSDLSVVDTLTNRQVLINPTTAVDLSPEISPRRSTRSSANGVVGHGRSSKDAAESSSSSSKVAAAASVEENECSFCLNYYNSSSCYFYGAQKSNIPFSPSACCLCCGGGEDDEDEQVPEEEDDDSSLDKTPIKVPNVNPGWFGKGYRKKIKKRK